MKQNDSKPLQSSIVSPTRKMAELEWDSLPTSFPQQTSSQSQSSTESSGLSTSAVVSSEGASYRQTHPNGTKIVGRLADSSEQQSTDTGELMGQVISRPTTKKELKTLSDNLKKTKMNIKLSVGVAVLLSLGYFLFVLSSMSKLSAIM